jgi:micrococcal nuclease
VPASWLKRALSHGALFCLCLPLDSLANKLCPATGIAETSVVNSVTDGDTLRLADGRKVRLIGINAPELAHDNRPAQPLGENARNALYRLLAQTGNRINLQYDSERQDKYQRTLAYVYLADGRSVQAGMLESGMATAFTTPPNDAQGDCYRSVEKIAIQQKRGIWALDDYRLKSVNQLKLGDDGFHRVSGRVSKISRTQDATWILLGEKFKIRIARNDTIYFDHAWLQQLTGKSIEIRGWLQARHYPFFMQLRHPHGLQLLNTASTSSK